MVTLKEKVFYYELFALKLYILINSIIAIVLVASVVFGEPINVVKVTSRALASLQEPPILLVLLEHDAPII